MTEHSDEVTVTLPNAQNLPEKFEIKINNETARKVTIVAADYVKPNYSDEVMNLINAAREVTYAHTRCVGGDDKVLCNPLSQTIVNMLKPTLKAFEKEG